MNIHDTSLSEAKRKGFRHPNQQPGWTDNSYKPSRTLEEANYLGDEEYHDRLGVHNPLWRYIIKRYSKESDAPLLVMGYEALPLAIELSQWTYPIVMVIKNEEEKKRVEYDAKRQAGFFKQILARDVVLSRAGYPMSRVAIFISIIDRVPDKEARDMVNHLLKGVKEVVCAVRPNRDWRSVFGKNLVDALRYSKGRWMLLRIN